MYGILFVMKNSQKKTILVTGGAGFIGSHLCERLLELGHEVICMDNFFTCKKDNIKKLCLLPNFEFIRHDICESFMLEVEEIYNLACPASPRYYQSDPVKTIKTNVNGAINVLEVARKTGARILQASTSEVYGAPDIHPQIESYNGNVSPIGIRACYNEGKRCAETLFFNYHEQYGVDIRIARIFNTYGSNMNIDDGRVISNFIIQSLLGENITVYGDGSQTRSFCYVSDLVEALILLMGFSGKRIISSPVNIGNPVEITIANLAKKIIKLVNTKSKIINEDLPLDDPCRRKPDISLVKELLNWFPRVSLDDGINETIEYFRGKLNEGR